MSLVDLLLMAEAARAHRAVRRTAYRHVHLTDRPLIVVAYNLSGEAAAPLGIMYGTDPATPKLVVAAEPRNRECRFDAINEFADDLDRYMRPLLALRTEPKRGGGFRQVASNAPQVIVPNRATRSYLGARLGRSLRYLGLDGTHDVPEATKWAGSHLSWLAEHANLPGQADFLAMTETLSEHFVTGQSALEDESLAALLAWIDGVPGDLLAELERIELEEAFGPVPNPKWEAKLEPHVKAWGDGLRNDDAAKMAAAEANVTTAVRTALTNAYTGTHRAVDILRGIDPAASVAARWANDIYEWGAHAKRAKTGIPMFARRHDALRAAASLQRWSAAAEELETAQAFDDPMIMARLDAEGRCVTGAITNVDAQNKEIKPGNQRATRVPLVELSLTGDTRLLAGEVVRWVGDKKIKGKVRSVGDGAAVVAITDQVKAFDTYAWPPGAEVMFVGLDPWEGPNPWGPDEIPWTHKEATTTELAGEAEPGDGSTDGSPDMSPDELAEIVVVGAVAPGAEPGVVV